MTSDYCARIVAWSSELLGREVHLIRSLSGGSHAVAIVVTDGLEDFVVRAYPGHDGAPMREATILPRLRVLGDRVPHLIACGDDRERSIIITSMVRGTPPDPAMPLLEIGAQLAAVLAQIHRLDDTGLRHAPAAQPRGDIAIARRARAEWNDLDTSETVLTHYDFWCGNALWHEGRLTGVIDWSGARSAPRGVDVAWCRLDLVLLGSIDAADRFLHCYEEQAGRTLLDTVAWDVQAAAQASAAAESWAPNYRDIGRADLTAEVLRQRLNDWTARL